MGGVAETGDDHLMEGLAETSNVDLFGNKRLLWGIFPSTYINLQVCKILIYKICIK
jgi:hypothetical protein